MFLTLGNFAIGTGVMIVPGMLNELSAVLAGWISAIDRRKLLAAASPANRQGMAGEAA